MAVNRARSMSADLAEGMSDGSYKKVVTDRGGSIDETTYAQREMLDDAHFGIHEAASKVLGDGTIHTTPDYVVTPTPNMTRW